MYSSPSVRLEHQHLHHQHQRRMSLSSIIVVALVTMTIFSAESGVSATAFDVLLANWFNTLTSNNVCSSTKQVCRVSLYDADFNLCKCDPSQTCAVDNSYCTLNKKDLSCKLLRSGLGKLFSTVGIARCIVPATTVPATTVPTLATSTTTVNGDYST